MFGTPFYHSCIRKSVVAFGTLFNNIQIDRRDASNNRYSIVTGKNNQVYAIGNVEGQVMAFRINR